MSFRTRKHGTSRQIGSKFPVGEKKKLPQKIHGLKPRSPYPSIGKEKVSELLKKAVSETELQQIADEYIKANNLPPLSVCKGDITSVYCYDRTGAMITASCGRSFDVQLIHLYHELGHHKIENSFVRNEIDNLPISSKAKIYIGEVLAWRAVPMRLMSNKLFSKMRNDSLIQRRKGIKGWHFSYPNGESTLPENVKERAYYGERTFSKSDAKIVGMFLKKHKGV